MYWRTMFRGAFAATTLGLLTWTLPGPQAARAAEPIKIGFSMPLTGGLASNGKAILAAYQMWEEDINAKAACSAGR
jgi:branched-chain amino acid transport system substrate-binding protein